MINITDQIMFNLGNLDKENLRITYQTSTGKILQKGSDDGAVFTKELYFDDKIRVYTGVQEQIKHAQTTNKSVDSTLANIKLELDTIKQSMLKSLNAGMQQSDKIAVATQIEGIKENFFTWANTNINNEYIFAGSNSTQQPFVKDANGKITYVGDNVLKQVPVEPNSYRERGVTGFDAFMYTADTAKVGEPLEFLSSEKIVDNEGNTWSFPESSGVGEKLDFFATDVITDNNGTVWTVNPLTSKLEDGSGGTIDLVKFNGGYQFKNNLPNQFLDGNSNVVTSFTATKITSTAAAAASFNISANDTVTDSTTGKVWTLDATTDPVNPTLSDGTTTLTGTVNAGGGFDFTNTSTNTLTMSSATSEVRQYDKYGNLTGEVLAVTQIDNGDGVSDGGDDTGLLEPKYRTANVTDPALILESKHNVFNDLDDLITTLNGKSLTDGVTPITEAEQNDIIRLMLDKMAATADAVSIAHSKVGSRNKIIDDASVNISAKLTNFNILSIENGQADMTKLALEAKSLELTYTALYSTISKMNNLSLVNFLK